MTSNSTSQDLNDNVPMSRTNNVVNPEYNADDPALQVQESPKLVVTDDVKADPAETIRKLKLNRCTIVGAGD